MVLIAPHYYWASHMGRRRKLDTLDAYKKALKQGFGLGRGQDYMPWLRVQDVPSKGTAAIVQGIKTRRSHHLLSQLEKQFFMLAEFSASVIDIREQFPLFPLDLLGRTAEALGIRYPTIPITQAPNVQTTDFLLELTGSGGRESSFLAVSVKPAKELQKERVLEKLELERVWWSMLGVDYRIFVGSEATKQQAMDIEWLTIEMRGGAAPTAYRCDAALRILETGTFSIEELVNYLADHLRCGCETALQLIKFLIVKGFVSIDHSVPILSEHVFTITNVRREGAFGGD